MTNLPIPLTTKTVSTKVAPDAWGRVGELAARLGARKSDIVSICLLFMDEELIEQKLAEQARALESMPKAVRGLLRDADKLNADQRRAIIEALSDPE
ncbi:hypothetical protein SAMN03159338_1621 [Sphingomonas sp. NFR04]|jgi:hypothetical protein|uniref:hypothetical protein n=1 Tax=Sphingomonas sp. NFR04 TaxID=1566283 RepID=UPI0008E087E9|nr:hypothetical protein [Sphingomonas sp. NFR04]SFJ51353.1 hypothetical protein SAMN03159338_1621 [Sphingomonas sp. NFR04]